MNRKNILRCLLGCLALGTAMVSLPTMKTLADVEVVNIEYKTESSIGWNYYNQKWHYFNENGVIQTGWLKEGENWYYL